MVKNLPANVGDLQETRVLSLGQKDPLEKGMATHSIILAGKFQEQRNMAGFHGVAESDMTEQLSTHTLCLK